MSEYEQLAKTHLAKARELHEQRQRIGNEYKNTLDLVRAAINMMPVNEREPYRRELMQMATQTIGLTDTVKAILETSDDFLTVAQIRDVMTTMMGFDFSSYASNPISSIYSVIKRMKRLVETSTLPDGSVGYRARKKPKDRK